MLKPALRVLACAFRSREALIAENLALRHQIEVLRRNCSKPALRWQDRVPRGLYTVDNDDYLSILQLVTPQEPGPPSDTLWVLLRRWWAGWRRPLRLVQPETVIAWHRKGWRLWWRFKSKPKEVGRPRVPWEVIELIRRISRENPTWGAPRIHGELMMLAHFVSEATVARYMVTRRSRPTQNRKTFLRNHLAETAAIDFLTVPTVMFGTLYVFVVLSLDRRRSSTST